MGMAKLHEKQPVHRTGESLGVPVHRVSQRESEGRIAQQEGINDVAGGEGDNRGLAEGVQPRPTAQLPEVQTSGPGSYAVTLHARTPVGATPELGP